MSVAIVRPEEKDLSRYAFAIKQLAEGRSNAAGSFTLTASATSTTVTAINCGADSKVFLEPRSANAAAARGTTYISAVSAGTFTVAHASNGQTDRTFDFVAVG